MRIYFSTTNLMYGLREAILETNVRNLLFSYYYKTSNFNDWFQLIKELNKPNVMIDSGAFSAWTGKKKIDRQSYLEFIYECKEKFGPITNDLHFVNLDVIPGEFGRKPTDLEIEESAKLGWENFEWFKSKGVDVIHVFHQHEDFKWLEKLMKASDYIGISPANDLSTSQRLPWLKKCFSIVRTRCKTHCFGGTSKEILLSVPFYSADSSSYAISRKFSPRFNRMKVPRGVHNRDIVPIIKKRIKEEIVKKQQLEDLATKVWKLRGIDL